MSLSDWLKNGWLSEHVSSKEEVRDLLGVCDRDLRDCRTAGLSPDWRFAIAYNAALQAATLALAVAGYRATRESAHFRVIHSLAHTLALDPAVVRRLDAFRKKRNVGGYEAAGQVSEQESAEVAALAEELRASVEAWIRKVKPELVP